MISLCLIRIKYLGRLLFGVFYVFFQSIYISMYDECNMWNVGACTYFVDVISFLSMMFICLCREQPPKLIVIKKTEYSQ